MEQEQTPKNILIVDDETAITLVFKEFLSLEGYQVFTAENGEAALKVIEEHKIDLIVTDYNMPGINGIELVDRVQERPEPPPCFIMISGFINMNSDELKEHGITEFFAKPVSFDAVLDAAKKYL